MVKRGMSLEEKRTVVVGIFHEHKRPFSLKEVEKLASKQGVTLQSVKDVCLAYAHTLTHTQNTHTHTRKQVLQSCVDDGLVDFDKIGSSNWFWSFPSKQASALRRRVEELEKTIDEARERKTRLEAEEASLLSERLDSEDRKLKMIRLKELRVEKERLSAELEEKKKNDPRATLKLVEKVEAAKAGAIRWTDNTYALSDFLKKTYGMTTKEVNAQLGIDDDFDYPVFAPMEPISKRQKA